MSEPRLYVAHVDVEDDPAYAHYRVVVTAETRSQAMKLAKEGAREAYRDEAGGWSLDPKTTLFSCRLLPLNVVGIVAAEGYIGR